MQKEKTKQMKKTAVKVTGLGKRYGSNQVLKEFSMEAERGKITCIMGRSGCGKTTLLRIMMGLETADEGEKRCLSGGQAV